MEIARAAGFRAVQSTPLVTGEGRVVGVLSTHFRRPRLPSAEVLYVTELYARQAAEILVRLKGENDGRETQEIIARELDHRLKNVITLIQAIARQTLGAAPEMGQVSKTFQGRLVALGRAHSLLRDGHWRKADLRGLLREQLLPFETARIAMSGPDVGVPTNAAYVLALLVHELVVNAQKHGALSAPAGRAALAWEIEPTAPALRLSWQERRGPPVREPSTSGFGSALINNLSRAAWSASRCATTWPASSVA